MTQQLEKEIYIPRRLEKTSFKRLPLSNNLDSFLTQNNISLIGDLRKISNVLLNKILTASANPFPELRHYILAFQENRYDEVDLISVEPKVLGEVNQLKTEISANQPSKIEQLLLQKIFIPLPARKWKVSALPLPKSLIHKLQISGFEKLFYVHGKTYGSFSVIKIFELKDIFDLFTLINNLLTISGFRSIESQVSAFLEETKTDGISMCAIEKAELGKANPLPTHQQKRHRYFGRKVEKTESRKVEFLPTESLRTQFPPTKFVVPLFTDQNFVVPKFLKTIPIDKFDLPSRLALIFESLQIQLLGDLEKISFKDFRKTNSHTAEGEVSFRKFLLQIENLKPQISDISTKQVQDKPEAFNSAALMRNINDFISRLPTLDKAIFLDRLGGISGEEVLTFEAIAHKNEITRERSYQIFLRTLNKFKETLQNRAAEILEKLRDECFTMVCPLTSKFLVNLVNQDYELFQYTVEFYIRLFGSLCPQLPILPKIENQIISLNAGTKKFEQEIISFLENQSLPVSLPEVFNQIMIYGSNKENIEDDFFEAIQSVKFNLMATDNPKELFIELSSSVR